MLIANQFIYSRERRRYGRQCLFGDRNELVLSVHPSGRLRQKYLLRNPVNKTTQLSPQFAMSTMLTENVSHDTRGFYHYEGGWPKEVNMADEEATLRHRKKVEREETWGDQMGKLIRDVLEMVAANNAVNIYQDFFEDIPEELGSEIKMKLAARPQVIFHDIFTPPRTLVASEFVPNNKRCFVSVFSNLKRLKKKYRRLWCELPGNGSDNSIFLWDVKNPLMPEAYYDVGTKEVLSIVKVCPKDDNQMAAGMHSGKVCLWNIDTKGAPKRICPLEAAHREVTSALCWVHSKSNTEFYSGSLDGSIKYWDMRDLKMSTQEILLEPDTGEIQNRQNSHGVTVLEFEYTIPVRYIMGSDMGFVFVGNRKGITPPDTILTHYRLFAGPIRSIMRNPFFVKNFLVVGDWRLRIWSEECKNAPSTLYIKKKNQMLCGAWSTGRCSLFVTGDTTGSLDFWDVLLDHRLPVLTVKFSQRITHVMFRSDGTLLAVSLVGGDSLLLRVEEGMTMCTGKEKALLSALLEREISRSKLLDARVEEMKMKRRTTQLLEEERFLREQEVEPVEIEIDIYNPDHFVQLIENDEAYRVALSDFHDICEAIATKRSARIFNNEQTIFEVMAEQSQVMTEIGEGVE